MLWYYLFTHFQWARQLGNLSNPKVNIPLHATEHFYAVTKPFEGILLHIGDTITVMNQQCLNELSCLCCCTVLLCTLMGLQFQEGSQFQGGSCRDCSFKRDHCSFKRDRVGIVVSRGSCSIGIVQFQRIMKHFTHLNSISFSQSCICSSSQLLGKLAMYVASYLHDQMVSLAQYKDFCLPSFIHTQLPQM